METKNAQNETKLWKQILTESKKSFRAKRGKDGKLLKLVSNYGLVKGGVAVRSTGEYAGFAVKVLESIKPLLTEARVSKAIKLLSDNSIQEAIRVLGLDDEVKGEGLGIMYKVLKIWLEKNELPIPAEYIEKGKDVDLDKPKFDLFKRWILLKRYEPLIVKVQVVSIGKTPKGGSVVPESWIGKTFDNGMELHKEMDKLDWRKGRPPVNFCCIHSMNIKDLYTWQNVSELDLNGDKNIVPKWGIEILPSVNLKDLNSIAIQFKDADHYINWLKGVPNDADILFNRTKYLEYIVIVCYRNRLFNRKQKYTKTDNVGVLVSRLQKSIRRGRSCAQLLINTINQLSSAKPYNLADQQFIKVSGCRQLTWRLFITIIEDAEPYSPYSQNYTFLSMMDLMCLSLICQFDPDIQFNKKLVDKLIKTGLAIQYNDLLKRNWDWRSGKEVKIPIKELDLGVINNSVNTAIKVALRSMPMMTNDARMLRKGLDYLNRFNLRKLVYIDPTNQNDANLNPNRSDNISANHSAVLASYDMHCIPNILIILQSAFPFVPYDLKKHTTRGLSSFIWLNSSRINTRRNISIPKDKETVSILNSLKSIQSSYSSKSHYIYDKKLQTNDYDLINKFIKDKNIIKPDTDNKHKPYRNISKLESRIGFLLLFGEKIRIISNKRYVEVVVGGDKLQPCKIKKPTQKNVEYLEGKDRFEGELEYVKYMSKDRKITKKLPNPPIGFKWKFPLSTKVVHLYAVLNKSNPKKLTNDISFYVNKYKLNPFDTSSILEPIKYPILDLDKGVNKNMDKSINLIISKALYVKDKTNVKGVKNMKNVKNSFAELDKYMIDDWKINILMRKLCVLRRENKDFRIFDWVKYVKTSELPSEIWKNLLVKLYNNYKDDVQIGPVNRRGDKLQESINYLYEGTIMRLLNLMCMLYPRAILPKGLLKYRLFKGNGDYQHMIDNITGLALNFNERISKSGVKIAHIDTSTFKVKSDQSKQIKNIKIKTKLWDHQKSTSDRIGYEMIELGRKGFGDASNVGAGKTLTSLAVMAKLLKHNSKSDIYGDGFLVMVPTTKLYKTWIDEIDKHTQGFIILKQQANGSILDKSDKKVNIDDIKSNHILITTLGRMRDHPILKRWILVVIDECLSVQNRDALQTQEAWRQVICSQYGVMMMSATFFRSRFDKLFYMLKMLRSGLPEEKLYLDTILSECIICHIPSKSKKWITNINKFELPHKMKKEYDNIRSQNVSSETLYNLLSKYLFDHYDYIKDFVSVINKVSELDKKTRALIYARSKNEADIISSTINSVSRYPDKSGKHVVVSYAEGTYGLNDLVLYDTIITRPPEPDKLPQMKGRLDRPGQKSNVLHIEYILIKDTIEEAWLFRLEMANTFHKNHILPLAKFYDIAIGK